MRSGVPLKVEGVVESFTTEGAEESLHLTVALQVSGQVSLQTETLVANLTLKFSFLCLTPSCRTKGNKNNTDINIFN
jgi:hypothetical protein